MKCVSRLFTLTLVWFWCLHSPLLAQDADGFDVLHYDNAITIADTVGVIHGRTQITGVFTTQQETLRVHFRDLSVDSVLTTGAVAAFTHLEGVLRIPTAPRTTVGDTSRITIWYAGTPTDGLIMQKNKYGRRTIFADNWAKRARYWFPCQDDVTDKAAVTFHVTAPCRYQVVANGVHTATTNHLNGTRTTSFDEPVPIPTYCMVIGAAELNVFRTYPEVGIPLSYWLYPEDTEDGLLEFQRVPAMLAYYSSRFGPYPYQKLALVQFSTMFHGMENANTIFLDEHRIGTEESIETIVAHEIVHQWFGNHITLRDWRHLWLSEGFAEYFGWQFFEHADGTAKFRSLLQDYKNRYLKDTTAHKSSIIAPEPDSLITLINANTYYKGAFVLHMLRNHLSDQLFWEGIARFTRRYRGKAMLTADFQQTMEAVSGESLEWFFHQWLYEPGIPRLTIESNWERSSKTLTLQVTQTQDGPMFRFPLEIALDDQQRKTVWIEARSHQFTFTREEEPNSIQYDPNIQLLARFKDNE